MSSDSRHIAPKTPLGVGLRASFSSLFARGEVKSVSWVEMITENLIDALHISQHQSQQNLKRVREHYDVVLHGVSLNLASSDPLNKNYLTKLKEACHRYQPLWVSDHLCWTGVDGVNHHDLLPFPYTQENLDHVAQRIETVQKVLRRPLVIENISSYLSFSTSEMQEWEFLNELHTRTGCLFLLDINNVYVNAVNRTLHGVDEAVWRTSAHRFLDGLKSKAVKQIHLAGHSVRQFRSRGETKTFLIDTHDHPVCDDVWDLYRRWIAKNGLRPTMVEWDAQIPSWKDLECEVLKAGKVMSESFQKAPLVPMATGHDFISVEVRS